LSEAPADRFVEVERAADDTIAGAQNHGRIPLGRSSSGRRLKKR
jgi:hypothetical protein